MSDLIAFGIALGSNIGDCRANLERGVSLLLERLPEAKLMRGASLYETDPVDCTPGCQPFLNSVIELELRLSPSALHAHLVAVEGEMGRPVEREKNSPRPLDLDLLYAGDYQSDDPVLTLPHPRLHLRRFVLQPLAEIRPLLRLPGSSLRIEEILAELEDDPQSVRLVGPWSYGGF